MKRLRYLLILIMLTGCIRCPDSVSVSPIFETTKDITCIDDVFNAFEGVTFTTKWYFGSGSEGDKGLCKYLPFTFGWDKEE